MKKFLLMLLLPLQLLAVDTQQVVVEEPSRTNRSAQVFWEQMHTNTTPFFATTNFVRFVAATNAYNIILSTLYPMISAWSERFSTNWSYNFQTDGGFNVDNFIVRDNFTSTVMNVTVKDVRARVLISDNASGFSTVTSKVASISGATSTLRGANTVSASFDQADISMLQSPTNVIVIDSPATFFNVDPVIWWSADDFTLPPGLHELASAVTGYPPTTGDNSLFLEAVLPPLTNFFGVLHGYTHTNNTLIWKFHLEPRPGPVVRASMQMAVQTGVTLAATSFSYSLMCMGDTILTHDVTVDASGNVLETGPAFAVLDTVRYLADPDLTGGVGARFWIDCPEEINNKQVFFRAWLDRLEGMTVCE